MLGLHCDRLLSQSPSPGDWITSGRDGVEQQHVGAAFVIDAVDAYSFGPSLSFQQSQQPTTNVENIPAIETQSWEEMLKRIEALEKQMKLTESQKADAASSKNKTGSSSEKSTETKSKTNEAEWIDVSKEKWNVKLGGHIQADYITWPNADPAIVGAQNYFSFRRLRLLADGTGYGNLDFRLQMTLEPGSGPNNDFATPDVKDAYLSMNEIPLIGRIRFGNFFVPFGLEQVTNDTMNVFNERSIPTQGIFTADREIGLGFYNHSRDQNVTWSGGIFFDNIDDTIKTRFDANQGIRLAGRLTWLPLYDEPSDGRYLIHTGLGVLYTNDQDNRVRFRARPQIQRGPVLMDTGTLDADSYTTGCLEGAVVWGPLTLQSEAYLCQVNMLNGETEHLNGMYAHISYFLTGECRNYERFGQHGAQFGRPNVYSNFFIVPGRISPGAIEAKARWSYLGMNRLNRGQYNDLTIGFNWYWNDRTRFMFDWIHPITTADAAFGATESDLLAMRMDVNW